MAEAGAAVTPLTSSSGTSSLQCPPTLVPPPSRCTDQRREAGWQCPRRRGALAPPHVVFGSTSESLTPHGVRFPAVLSPSQPFAYTCTDIHCLLMDLGRTCIARAVKGSRICLFLYHTGANGMRCAATLRSAASARHHGPLSRWRARLVSLPSSFSLWLGE